MEKKPKPLTAAERRELKLQRHAAAKPQFARDKAGLPFGVEAGKIQGDEKRLEKAAAAEKCRLQSAELAETSRLAALAAQIAPQSPTTPTEAAGPPPVE